MLVAQKGYKVLKVVKYGKMMSTNDIICQRWDMVWYVLLKCRSGLAIQLHM